MMFSETYTHMHTSLLHNAFLRSPKCLSCPGLGFKKGIGHSRTGVQEQLSYTHLWLVVAIIYASSCGKAAEGYTLLSYNPLM